MLEDKQRKRTRRSKKLLPRTIRKKRRKSTIRRMLLRNKTNIQSKMLQMPKKCIFTMNTRRRYIMSHTQRNLIIRILITKSLLMIKRDIMKGIMETLIMRPPLISS